MKEKMRIVLRSNIITDHLKGMSYRAIVKKYKCSARTVCKWVNYYKKKKAELDLANRGLRIRKERLERAERSLRGQRGMYAPASGNDRERNLEKEILEDLDKIDLSKKKRKEIVTRIPYRIQQYLYKQFADRRTGGKEGRSIRKVVAKANKKFNLKDWKRMKEFVPKEQRRLTTGSVHRFLVKKFGRARKLIKKPLLKPSHISQRKAFAEYIVKNEIDHTKIFFTDEKRFIMNFVPNKQTNQIRLKKKTKMQLKQGDEEVEKLLTIPVEKHPKGVMVAGGVSSYGVGKLNFIVGSMDSYAYAQTLDNYQKDMDYYHELGVDLIFQQDNCPSHVSADIKQKLSKMRKLDFWPPNSPDLSPIESVWSEVQSKLEGYTFKSMDDFKKKIVYEWNRVPVEYCQRICKKFIDDIQQIYKYGRIKEKHHLSKGGLVFKQRGVYTDEIENIVFNKVSMRNVIKYNIRDLKKVNHKLKPIIFKLRKLIFKKKIQDELNIESFDHIYDEILKENEDIYMKNKSKISKLRRMKLEDYFNSLTKGQQVKLCNLVARYNDEIKFEGVPQEPERKMSLGDRLLEEEEKTKGDNSELNKESTNNTNAKDKEKDNDITTTLSDDKKESEANYKIKLKKDENENESDSSSDSYLNVDMGDEPEEKKEEEPKIKRKPGRPRKNPIPEYPKMPFIVTQRSYSRKINPTQNDVIDLDKDNKNEQNNKDDIICISD